jgi:hypothetical protein
MNDSDNRRRLESALGILNNVRQRPEMYFSPITPEAVEQWLHGFQAGLLVADLQWPPWELVAACERRGVTLYSTTDLLAELRRQGMTEEQVAMTLVDIALEMWRSLL